MPDDIEDGATICPDCGEDLPWHRCRDAEGEKP